MPFMMLKASWSCFMPALSQYPPPASPPCTSCCTARCARTAAPPHDWYGSARSRWTHRCSSPAKKTRTSGKSGSGTQTRPHPGSASTATASPDGGLRYALYRSQAFSTAFAMTCSATGSYPPNCFAYYDSFLFIKIFSLFVGFFNSNVWI